MATFLFTTFESPSNNTYLNGINAFGELVGYYWVRPEEFAFKNSAGNYFFLNYPSDAYVVRPFGINSIGDIVGIYSTNDARDHGFLYTASNGYSIIDEPGAGSEGETNAFGINDAGDIVGSFNDGTSTYGFIYNSSTGNYSTLIAPGSTGETIAFGINATGQVVGLYYDGTVHGFLYSEGKFSSIDAPLASAATGGTQAVGINEVGQIVGVYFDGTGAMHGYYYDHGSYQTLDYPGASSTVATGINSHGQVSGYYFDAAGVHGFVANRREVPKISIEEIDGSTADLSGAQNSAAVSFRLHLSGKFAQPFVVELVPNADSDDDRVSGGKDTQYSFDWQLDDTTIEFEPSDFDGIIGVPDADGLVVNADGSLDKIITVHVDKDLSGESALTRYFTLGVSSSDDYSVAANGQAAVGTIHSASSRKVTAAVTGLDPSNKLTPILLHDFQAAVDRFVDAVGAGELKSINIQVELVTLPKEKLARTVRDTLSNTTTYKQMSPSADIDNADEVLVPNMLLRYWGKVASSAVDFHIELDLQKIASGWYSGRADAYDATTILTHELLHAAGIGQGDVIRLPQYAWDTHTKQDQNGQHYNLNGRKIELIGTDDVEGSNHLEEAADLMYVSLPRGKSKEISDIDIAILRDFGYSKVSSAVGNGLHDAIAFNDASAGYTVQAVTGGVLVSGPGSPITLVSGIEFLHFSDKTFFIEGPDNANIARLYSAALGRPPDVAGLSGWEDIYSANISAVAKAGGVYKALAQTDNGFGTSIAGGFTQSLEFQAKYGNLTDAGFVTQLYLNVLARTPSAGELSAWVDLIQHGDSSGTHFSREMVLVGFAESPENIAKTAADWLIQIG